ncbi:MAG: methyl-accepting chemotaxis protein [Spirochaetia bacterium]
MVDPGDRISSVYGDQQVNIRLKSRNLFYVAAILGVVTFVLSIVHIVNADFGNLGTSLSVVILSLIAAIAVVRGYYRAASSVFLAFLALMPFIIMLIQDVQGYRDMYLYGYLSLPVLAIAIVVGYRQIQLYMVAAILCVLGAVYTLLLLVPAPGVVSPDLLASAIIALLFFVLTVGALHVGFGVEKSIMDTLALNDRQASDRLEGLRALLRRAETSLSQGEQLSRTSAETVERTERISARLAEIAQSIAGLNEEIDTALSTQKTLTGARERVNEVMQEQSSAVEESSAAITEMSASIGSLTEAAENRKSALESLSRRTGETDATFQQTLESFEGLRNSSEELLEVTGVIEDVANRTNLLAMNAAIEAAHAGQSGRGFAVVAEEVRKLAEETNENSRRIRGILERNAENIRKSLEVGDQTRSQFAAIRDEVGQFSDSLTEFVNGMSEMSGGTSEINEAVENIRGVQQRVTHAIEEMQQALADSGQSFGTIQNLAGEVTNVSEAINDEVRSIEDTSRKLAEIGASHHESLSELKEQLGAIER